MYKRQLDGIRKAVSPSTKVNYVKGCAIRDVTTSNIPAAVEAARAADAVVLVVGGSDVYKRQGVCFRDGRNLR